MFDLDFKGEWSDEEKTYVDNSLEAVKANAEGLIEDIDQYVATLDPEADATVIGAANDMKETFQGMINAIDSTEIKLEVNKESMGKEVFGKISHRPTETSVADGVEGKKDLELTINSDYFFPGSFIDNTGMMFHEVSHTQGTIDKTINSQWWKNAHALDNYAGGTPNEVGETRVVGDQDRLWSTQILTRKDK